MDIAELKDYILELTDGEIGEPGYFKFVDAIDDNGDRLTVWKYIRGSSWYLSRYEVVRLAHLDGMQSQLYPKTIDVTVSSQRNETGSASVDVMRQEGSALLTPSARSSDKVIEELTRLTQERVNTSALFDFENYSLDIRWQNDHYQINRA